MRAGRLRQQVTIQSLSQGTDDRGSVTESATTFKTLRCSVTPLQGRELEAAQQVVATVSHRLDARWTPGITPAMRVSWNGRYFDINAIINVDELNREMQLLCTERVGLD